MHRVLTYATHHTGSGPWASFAKMLARLFRLQSLRLFAPPVCGLSRKLSSHHPLHTFRPLASRFRRSDFLPEACADTPEQGGDDDDDDDDTVRHRGSGSGLVESDGPANGFHASTAP